MIRLPFIIIGLILLNVIQTKGQDADAGNQRRVFLSGYIKNMLMLVDNPLASEPFYANQLHNRMRLSWFSSGNLYGRLELRNRLYSGSLVSDIPGFTEALSRDNGMMDLSFSHSVGTHSAAVAQLDRAWLGFRKGKWDINAGRQRINWGMNTVWNPNDVFNAYDVFDFDYEERPGSDALRIQYATGNFSFVEAAVSKGSHEDDVRYALMNRFNFSGYDVQVLTGMDSGKPFAGIGWAGSIKKAGFKTEATWYFSHGSEVKEEQIIISSGVDYSFKSGWYINSAFLYNNKAGHFSEWALGNIQQAGNPFPFELAGLLQTMKEITPIFSINVTAIYSNDNLLVLMPGCTWSVARNWDLFAFGQYYRLTDSADSESVNAFLRLRWSFAR